MLALSLETVMKSRKREGCGRDDDRGRKTITSRLKAVSEKGERTKKLLNGFSSEGRRSRAGEAIPDLTQEGQACIAQTGGERVESSSGEKRAYPKTDASRR